MQKTLMALNKTYMHEVKFKIDFPDKFCLLVQLVYTIFV